MALSPALSWLIILSLVVPVIAAGVLIYLVGEETDKHRPFRKDDPRYRH